MLMVTVVTPIILGSEMQESMAVTGRMASPQGPAPTKTGLVVDGVEWRGLLLYIVCIIKGDLIGSIAGILLGCIAMLATVMLERGRNAADEARASAQNFRARDAALDFPALNQNTQWLKTVICFALYTVVCFVNFACVWASFGPTRGMYGLAMTLIPTGAKLSNHFTGTPQIPISVTSCVACVADGNWFIMLVAGCTVGYSLLMRQREGEEGRAGRSGGKVKHAVEEIGARWKSRLNGMSQELFYKYRLSGIADYERGDYVSRGGVKLDQILDMAEMNPRGSGVDLGCGRGGWTQALVRRKDVTGVKAYTKGGDKLEWPQRFDTLGYNLAEFASGVDVHEIEPFPVTSSCAISVSPIQAGRRRLGPSEIWSSSGNGWQSPRRRTMW